MSRDFEMKVDFDDVIAMFDGLSDAAKGSRRALSRRLARRSSMTPIPRQSTGSDWQTCAARSIRRSAKTTATGRR